MSHVTSQQAPVVPAEPQDFGATPDPAVKAALKATLGRELAREAAAPDGVPAPQHMAGPGRFVPTG